MPLLTIVITLIVIGELMWLVNTHIPMSDSIKKVLNIVVLIVVVILLLNLFGALAYLGNVSVGRIR